MTAGPQRRAERRLAEQAWRDHALDRTPTGVPDSVRDSWDRSRASVDRAARSAPVAQADRVAERWRDSPLRDGVAVLRDELDALVADGHLVCAITQADGTILWTAGSRWMKDRAAQVNFAPGGRWDEASIGTNAMAVALATRAPARVFSAQHWVEAVHDWVCWSAPVLAPDTGRLLGVVDLSTTWDRAHTTGMATASLLARQLSLLVPAGAVAADDPGLVVRVLGRPEVVLDGLPMTLPPRQLELLTILALRPDGLTLEQLHTALVRDGEGVRPASVKSELSHLRRRLGGAVSSRPYRLGVPVRLDVDDVLAHLRAGRLARAVEAYRGPLLPASEAPALVDQRNVVDHALRHAVLRSRDPGLLLALSAHHPHDVHLLEAAVDALPSADPRVAVALARREAALR